MIDIPARQTDRQTDTTHLVVSEVVALHELVDDGENLIIVKEVDTFHAARTVTDVTVQLYTPRHTHVYTPRHTHTYTPWHIDMLLSQ